MKILSVLGSLVSLVALVMFFIDWRIGAGLAVTSVLFSSIPLGPDRLMKNIIGILLTAGIIVLFFDWRIGIGLIFASFLVGKLYWRMVDCQHKYYTEQADQAQDKKKLKMSKTEESATEEYSGGDILMLVVINFFIVGAGLLWLKKIRGFLWILLFASAIYFHDLDQNAANAAAILVMIASYVDLYFVIKAGKK